MTSWRGCWVHFWHVPRGENQQADWLAQAGLSMYRTLLGVEDLVPELREEHAPPLQLDLTTAEPPSQAATWEVVVDGRKLAVLVHQEALTSDCSVCGGTVGED